jgi:hypothetical protein
VVVGFNRRVARNRFDFKVDIANGHSEALLGRWK